MARVAGPLNACVVGIFYIIGWAIQNAIFESRLVEQYGPSVLPRMNMLGILLGDFLIMIGAASGGWVAELWRYWRGQAGQPGTSDVARSEEHGQCARTAGPRVYAAVVGEERRLREHIQLIPSENYPSAAVLEANGSVMTQKYAEGYPGYRFYRAVAGRRGRGPRPQTSAAAVQGRAGQCPATLR